MEMEVAEIGSHQRAQYLHDLALGQGSTTSRKLSKVPMTEKIKLSPDFPQSVAPRVLLLISELVKLSCLRSMPITNRRFYLNQCYVRDSIDCYIFT